MAMITSDGANDNHMGFNTESYTYKVLQYVNSIAVVIATLLVYKFYVSIASVLTTH